MIVIIVNMQNITKVMNVTKRTPYFYFYGVGKFMIYVTDI